MNWPWSELGLPGPAGLPEIRRAYAEKLKDTHPEDDPEGFQQLHEAFQLASRMARQQKRRTEESPPPKAEQPPAPEHGAPDFDYERLLQQSETPPQQEKQQDFDFERLFAEEEPPPPPPQEKQQDFDFERLFAEGEAERAQARLHRARERRGEFWERARRENGKTVPEEDRWRGTENLLHTMELLYNAQAGLDAWRKFFQSPLFRQGRGSTDLIFGLEDFVSAHPGLPREVREELFLAFGFDRGVSRPELRPLYQMLLPAWRGKTGNLRAMFGGILTSILVMIALSVVDQDLLPYLAVLWVAVMVGLSTGWFRKERKGSKFGLLVVGVLLAATVVIGLIPPDAWDSARRALPTSDPREQVCRYLEEDFGERFRALYDRENPDERYNNVFAQQDDPDRQFMAGPSGERDVQNGNMGYTTNYPEMRMLWELREFGSAHGITGVDSVDRGLDLERWKTSGTFPVAVPLYGAGETIEELGEYLLELAREPWYQAQVPDCEVLICSRPMREGQLILYQYRPGKDGLGSGKELRALYEGSFGFTCCAQLLKDLNLDRDFIHGGEESFTLTEGGMARLRDEECFKLYGLDSSGAVAQEYYVNVEETAIYCVPGDFWETGGGEEQISFYRLLHHKDADENPLRVLNLYYPWLKVVSH